MIYLIESTARAPRDVKRSVRVLGGLGLGTVLHYFQRGPEVVRTQTDVFFVFVLWNFFP